MVCLERRVDKLSAEDALTTLFSELEDEENKYRAANNPQSGE